MMFCITPKVSPPRLPSRPLRAFVKVVLFLLAFSTAQAEVAPASISAPTPEAWTGQRLPFFIKLSARGSFSGTATFSIPQIPRTVILKMDNPVVSSETIDGEDWFTQLHEFALFSQHSGRLEIPSFPIRFSAKDGFTGPANEINTQVPKLSLTIQRPPGSEELGFLITTDSLSVTETWQPQPGPAEVGAIFKRSITQRASNMTGMALAPAPTELPDGIRLYPGKPEVTDKTQRGDFLGERRETLTYLIEKPGTLTLPELSFVCWNPKLKKLETKTLPAVTFEVPAPPPTAAETSNTKRRTLILALASLLVVASAIWQRKRLVTLIQTGWKKLNPPDQVAARKLLRACRHNDPTAAATAWSTWQNTRNSGTPPSPALHSAALGLQRHLFGPAPSSTWTGHELASAFHDSQTARKSLSEIRKQTALPPLNPP